MKKLMVLATLGLALNASAVEFKTRVLNADCHIKGSELTRTQYFGKNLEGSFTEKKSIEIKGIQPLVDRALGFASRTPREESEMSYAIIKEGERHYITATDSAESQSLIRILNKICR